MHIKRLYLLTIVLMLAADVSAVDASWPDFRGPTRNGYAPDDAKPPTTWADGKGVVWKTATPGAGHSSPVVSGNSVWLTTALDEGRSLHAVCLDLASGKLLHDIEVFRAPNPGPKHDFNSFASPSPVVDDQRVYLWFGTHGLACLDARTAEPIWKKTDFDLDFLSGAGSSPVLFNDLLILECDAVNAQYVLALDSKTGQQVWRTERSQTYEPNAPQKKRSFSTAVVERIGGVDVLLSVGAQRAYGYDVATGRELFYVDHPGYSNVARPLLVEDLMIFSTGYNRAELWAVRLPKELSVPKPAVNLNAQIAWRSAQGIPNKPSLTEVGGRLYLVADTGVARCLDARNGSLIWTERLGQKYSASPLYAGGLIYFFAEGGEVHVLKPSQGKAAEIVQKFKLDEGFMGSPAVAGNTLLLRSAKHVYRVGSNVK